MAQFKLFNLSYKENDLEPIISAQTISFHHGKHLQGYVNNLNKAIVDTPFAEMDIVEIVKKASGGILNNAGQILNHNLYFEQFRKPSIDNKPSGKLAAAIEKQFGSFEAFQKEFEQAGTTLFGSGWVWLSIDNDGKLIISQESNASNPIMKGFTPLLTFDVWEHAYYLDYQNRRADHLHELWQIVNWEVIEKRGNQKTY